MFASPLRLSSSKYREDPSIQTMERSQYTKINKYPENSPLPPLRPTSEINPYLSPLQNLKEGTKNMNTLLESKQALFSVVEQPSQIGGDLSFKDQSHLLERFSAQKSQHSREEAIKNSKEETSNNRGSFILGAFEKSIGISESEYVPLKLDYQEATAYDRTYIPKDTSILDRFCLQVENDRIIATPREEFIVSGQESAHNSNKFEFVEYIAQLEKDIKKLRKENYYLKEEINELKTPKTPPAKPKVIDTQSQLNTELLQKLTLEIQYLKEQNRKIAVGESTFTPQKLITVTPPTAKAYTISSANKTLHNSQGILPGFSGVLAHPDIGTYAFLMGVAQSMTQIMVLLSSESVIPPKMLASSRSLQSSLLELDRTYLSKSLPLPRELRSSISSLIASMRSSFATQPLPAEEHRMEEIGGEMRKVVYRRVANNLNYT